MSLSDSRFSRFTVGKGTFRCPMNKWLDDS